MKICYNCFHQSDSSTHYCENCGFPMDPDKQNICPDAIPCGTTLYGRYLIGRVLKQDSSSITYMAQDSRSKGTVAIREFFPKAWSVRTPMRTVSVPEQNRDDYLVQKDEIYNYCTENKPYEMRCKHGI